MASPTSTTPAPPASTPNPSEVGWQFVPKYYTFLNKQPSRLHCFYTKASVFNHGVEGEETTPCHGQIEIHNKITSMNFVDCKVFIHSVDAQSSAMGGITILVIGEMSNNAGPWRKFVQSFFLAEQPNGYFVLNDMFRFLKEEGVEEEEGEEEAEAEDAEVDAPAVPAQETHIPVHPLSEPTPPVEEAPKLETTTATVPEIHTNGNGHATSEDDIQAESPVIVERPSTPQPTADATSTVPSPSPSPAPTPAAPAPSTTAPPPAATTAPAPQQPTPATTPAPPAVAAPQPSPSPAPVVAPTPAAPPQPKTWANLAATNSKKWGASVATESRGITEVLPASPTPPPTQRGPPQHQQHHHHQNGPHPAYVAAQSVTTAHCFVKGVTEPVTQTALTNLLARFGPITSCEIVRSKACAFLEFASIDAAKKAIIASLPHNAGGENGLKLEVDGVGQLRITVETKKERGDRPVSRPRGGAPPAVNGNGSSTGDAGRGSGFRGGRGGGSRGAPRGAAPPK